MQEARMDKHEKGPFFKLKVLFWWCVTYSGFKVTGKIERSFWVLNFRFRLGRDFIGYSKPSTIPDSYIL